MNVLKTAVQEVIGLFIEDGRYAAAICIWIAFVWFALPRLGIPPEIRPILLFVGLAVLLVENVARSARKK